MTNHGGEKRLEVLMTDLRIGEQFLFDGDVVTVTDPPEESWGVVDVWVEELDFPLQGGTLSTVDIVRTGFPRGAK